MIENPRLIRITDGRAVELFSLGGIRSNISCGILLLSLLRDWTDSTKVETQTLLELDLPFIFERCRFSGWAASSRGALKVSLSSVKVITIMRVGIVNVLVAMLLPWFAAGGIGNRLRRFLSSKIQRKSRNATKLEYRPLVTEKWDRPHPLPGAAPFGAVDPKEKKREGVVASFGYGRVSEPGYSEWVYIDDVYVEEKWRRKGVATRLITRFLGYLKTGWASISGAYLGVDPPNPGAVVLYEGIGFVQNSSFNRWDFYVFDFNEATTAVANLSTDPPPEEMKLPTLTHKGVMADYRELFLPHKK